MILRLRGWMLSLKGDVEGAEWNFLASLAWARPPAGEILGAAHGDQPRTTVQSLGKRWDAYELFAPAYGWFTEGFDTRDLQEAKALLVELRVARPVT
jgi:hypothetical protein